MIKCYFFHEKSEQNVSHRGPGPNRAKSHFYRSSATAGTEEIEKKEKKKGCVHAVPPIWDTPGPYFFSKYRVPPGVLGNLAQNPLFQNDSYAIRNRNAVFRRPSFSRRVCFRVPLQAQHFFVFQMHSPAETERF